MENNGIRFRKYFKEYKVANVMAMIRNNSKKPEVCTDDCRGKLVVITGATSGIGYETARKYAAMGADLVCINRSKEKSDALKSELEGTYQVACQIILADLSVMAETYRAAQALLDLDKPIDILVHNAGIYLTKRQITPDGIEKVFMVNHLSSFIINYLLMDKLKAQGKCRIILVNSEGHRFAAWGMRFDDLDWTKQRYAGLKSYGTAKLAQLLSMIRFEEFYRDSGVTINAMHPGAVKSATGQDNGRIYKWFKKNSLDKALKPTSLAAEAIYFLGISPKLREISGKFFNLTTQEEPAPPAVDHENADILWARSIEMAKVHQHDEV